LGGERIDQITTQKPKRGERKRRILKEAENRKVGKTISTNFIKEGANSC